LLEKLARLLSRYQKRKIATYSDSYEAECNAPHMDNEEVESRPQSPGSTSSQIPSTTDFSVRTSEDKDAVQNVADQQSQPAQWSLPFAPERV
jgi:hypothetical protein